MGGGGWVENIRAAKEAAVLAQRRDRHGAARERCRAPLADPLLPKNRSRGKARSRKQAWLGAPPKESLAQVLL